MAINGSHPVRLWSVFRNCNAETSYIENFSRSDDMLFRSASFRNNSNPPPNLNNHCLKGMLYEMLTLTPYLP
jgi:hypothetical protein